MAPFPLAGCCFRQSNFLEKQQISKQNYIFSTEKVQKRGVLEVCIPSITFEAFWRPKSRSEDHLRPLHALARSPVPFFLDQKTLQEALRDPPRGCSGAPGDAQSFLSAFQGSPGATRTTRYHHLDPNLNPVSYTHLTLPTTPYV